jgi:WD40 repeat protein
MLTSRDPEARDRPIHLAWPDHQLTIATHNEIFVQCGYKMIETPLIKMPPTIWTSVAWSPDGQQVSFAQSSMIQLRNASENSLVLRGHTWPVSCMAWSPNGRQLVSGSDDKTVRLWNVVSGTPGHVLQGHTDILSSVAWSPNGLRVVSGSFDKTVRLWDAASGAPGPVLQGHIDSVTSVAWSPDGLQIVSGSVDKTVRLWDAASGAPGPVLRGHIDSVTSVAWSPDGRQIVSGSGDKTVRLWNAVSGAPGQILADMEDPILCVASSPSGSVAACSLEGFVLVWYWAPTNLALKLKYKMRIPPRKIFLDSLEL